ncbi:MAG: ATP-binding protein [Candidatus Onthomonas sp.]
MRRKIFWYIFAGAMAVFVACFSVTMWAVYGYFNRESQEQLEGDAAYLSAAVQAAGVGFLEDMEQQPAFERITWIDADGSVLYDSEVDPGTLENHNQREEVLQARETGIGQSVRYSQTLSIKTTNYAVLQEDGRVLRVSSTQRTMLNLILGMWLPILAVILLAVVLSALLAARVARSVTRPVNEIDLEHPDENAVYPELRPLARRINSQNRQIQRQMELLVQEHQRQDRIRREFTANVSHELKTPLTSISGYAEIIHAGIAKPEDIQRFSGKIYDEAQRLQALVGDIIQLSRLEELGSELDREPVELYRLCQEVAQRFQPQADGRDLTLTVEGSPQTIQGSPVLLREMVGNLCDNAIKYNREGGSVVLSVNRVGDRVVLSVRDTGIGIPEEDQSRVFERFYRVDKSHSKAVGGTGLGLSIVKHGAACHNAQIQLESQPGQGTEIRLSFQPAEQDDPV